MWLLDDLKILFPKPGRRPEGPAEEDAYGAMIDRAWHRRLMGPVRARAWLHTCWRNGRYVVRVLAFKLGLSDSLPIFPPWLFESCITDEVHAWSSDPIPNPGPGRIMTNEDGNNYWMPEDPDWPEDQTG